MGLEVDVGLARQFLGCLSWNLLIDMSSSVSLPSVRSLFPSILYLKNVVAQDDQLF